MGMYFFSDRTAIVDIITTIRVNIFESAKGVVAALRSVDATPSLS
jgi:hypothetical protein